MTPLSDSELLSAISELESDRVERKQTWAGSAPDTVRQAICAFANDLPNHQKPGVVLIGVSDAGQVVGTPITDELLITLANIKTDGKILPPPYTYRRETNSGRNSDRGDYGLAFGCASGSL